MVEKINRLVYILLFLTALTAGCLVQPAVAATGLSVITDAQTQNYLAKIVQPLFKAGNVAFNPQKIFIIKDNSLNAFVSDGNYLFIHTGTLTEAENTNELAGILAHETGHIMGGHIVRQKLKLEKMQYIMLGSMIAAGATAVSTGRGDAAMAVILGSQSSVLNNMLQYQMQEERSADESAVKLLTATKQSTDGLRKFMNKIKRNNALSGIDENGYFRTHPLTSERIAHFTEVGKNNHFSTENPLDSELLMIKAKLTAFLADTSKAWRQYPKYKKSSDAQYAHAILYFREGRIKESLAIMDSLLQSQPNNPYFYELKGQILFESGQTKVAIKAYEQALNFLADNPLLQTSLAQAILESSPDKLQIQRAIDLLQQALIKQNNGFIWQLLARAYDMKGDKAYSYYAAAEFNYSQDNLETVLRLLENAEQNTLNKSLNLKIKDLRERTKEDMKENSRGLR